MLASLLLTFREGLEAALIVGIILGYLTQIGHQDRRGWVWAAVASAVALSIGVAIALEIIGAKFEGTTEYVFEGIAMLTAVVVLTWMIFWMRNHAHAFTQNLKNDLHDAISTQHNWALFGVAFLAVFREGIETALFLTAARLASDGVSTVVGGSLGLVLAVIAGWAIYSSSARLNVRRFFDVTSVLLLVFAAGLFAHGIHEFQEAGLLPLFVEHLWDTKAIVDDGSTGGAILRVLVGYNDNPSLLEVIGYIAYWLTLVVSLNWWSQRRTVRQTVTSGA